MGDAASASAGLRATVGKGNRVRTGRRHVPWSFLGPRWRARPVTLSQITTSHGVLIPLATRLIGWGGVARGGRGRALTRRHMDVFLEAGAETQFFSFFFFLPGTHLRLPRPPLRIPQPRRPGRALALAPRPPPPSPGATVTAQAGRPGHRRRGGGGADVPQRWRGVERGRERNWTVAMHWGGRPWRPS